MSEQAEGELITALRKLLSRAGPEALEVMQAMVVELVTPQEDEIRRTDPDNPALKLLDARRRKAERGFE